MDDDTPCPKCGLVTTIGMFPFCKGNPSDHIGGTSNRGHDEIPGGVWIENLGPNPVKVYSHSERLALAKSRGLTEFVRHMPVPGSDKSPHTTDWSKGSIDAKTLDNAKELVSRQGGIRHSESESTSLDSSIRPLRAEDCTR